MGDGLAMREKLNENPVAQIVLVAVLVAVVGYFALTKLGGSSESEGAATDSAGVEGPVVGEEGAASLETAIPTASTSAAAAPVGKKLPHAVDAAYASNYTVVLLIFRSDGIDDRLVRQAAADLRGMAGVALFPVPIKQVATYSSITGPVGVNQAPALVVVRKRGMNDGGPAPTSVDYGFRDAAEIRQAVRDANYTGPQLSYAPN
jgi:hypothetical protein